MLSQFSLRISSNSLWYMRLPGRASFLLLLTPLAIPAPTSETPITMITTFTTDILFMQLQSSDILIRLGLPQTGTGLMLLSEIMPIHLLMIRISLFRDRLTGTMDTLGQRVFLNLLMVRMKNLVRRMPWLH